MRQLSKQKQIENQVKDINKKAAEDSLNLKSTILFIDPLPEEIETIKNLYEFK